MKAVWHIVRESAKSIGVAKLAPHDLLELGARLWNGRPYGQNRRIVLNLVAMRNIEQLYRGFPAQMKSYCIVE